MSGDDWQRIFDFGNNDDTDAPVYGETLRDAQLEASSAAGQDP
jgi:hypothetical protein